MNCEGLETRLIEYLDGRLDGQDKAAVERHLASCAGCAARAEGFRSVFLSLDAWEAPEISPWFNARLRRRIAAEEERRSWRGRLGVLLRPVHALGMAGGVAVVLLAGALVMWNTRRTPLVVNQPVPQPAAVEHRMEEIIPVVEDYEILANFDMLGELKREKNKL